MVVALGGQRGTSGLAQCRPLSVVSVVGVKVPGTLPASLSLPHPLPPLLLLLLVLPYFPRPGQGWGGWGVAGSGGRVCVHTLIAAR